MKKYKVNCIFNEDGDINEIVTKTLKIELKKYLKTISKNSKLL